VFNIDGIHPPGRDVRVRIREFLVLAGGILSRPDRSRIIRFIVLNSL
jgi:hypothetical protein